MNRRKRYSNRPPPLDEDLILEWADAHFKRTGAWPNAKSGHIPESVEYWRTWRPGLLVDLRGDTWIAVAGALYQGRRGLLPDSSLPNLLEQRRGVFNINMPPNLTYEVILEWADAHFQRTQVWPNPHSGLIPESEALWTLKTPVTPFKSRCDSWQNVDAALRMGGRGLEPMRSLINLLELRRGVFNVNLPPDLTEELILEWVDAYFKRTGEWPGRSSGHIPESVAYWQSRRPGFQVNVPGDRWSAVDAALHGGLRGLKPNCSLVKLLEQCRGVLNVTRPPKLTEDLILQWADAYFERTGSWPTHNSGVIPESEALWALKTPVTPFKNRNDSWQHVDTALRTGIRGLEPLGGLERSCGLHQLFVARRGARNYSPPDLRPERILQWAHEHHERTGQWPSKKSGRVSGIENETWGAVNRALARGTRGLPGKSSLARLLANNGLIRHQHDLPNFNEETILEWADAHHSRHGGWPNKNSGQIPEAPGETWDRVNGALSTGLRGLPPGTSLTKLLERCRSIRSHSTPPALSEDLILIWADNHHARHGRYPVQSSGKVDMAPEETWNAIDAALRYGRCGLPTGSSLSRLLLSRRGIVLRHTETVSAEEILAWADDHNERCGRYPNSESGPIAAAPGRTWMQIHEALRFGKCGFPGGSGIVPFLEEHGRSRIRNSYPDLTEEQIFSWAQDFLQRSGSWPTRRSGAIEGSQGDDWGAVDSALKNGKRGLFGGSSLAKFLMERADQGSHQPRPHAVLHGT